MEKFYSVNLGNSKTESTDSINIIHAKFFSLFEKMLKSQQTCLQQCGCWTNNGIFNYDLIFGPEQAI